ncbi:MAG: BON domain-containing protein [Betaproteobacteria bacterium]|nr:BON domain-containing protein [Betaproteobacteria bacterium]
MKRLASLTLAAAFCALAAACASSGDQAQQQDTAGMYIDDATITAKVKTAIATDVGVKAAANVSVDTSRGVVQLAGFADSQDQADRAVQAAKKVSGVRSVRNDIRLKSSS